MRDLQRPLPLLFGALTTTVGATYIGRFGARESRQRFRSLHGLTVAQLGRIVDDARLSDARRNAAGRELLRRWDVAPMAALSTRS